MKEIFNTILTSLSKGNFLETDGTAYWWVEDNKYHVISKNIFKSFINKKLVYSKRIDDETTCYYLSAGHGDKITPKFSSKTSIDDYKTSKIRSFINL